MTPFEGLLDDEEVAAVLTFVRNSFGNEAPSVSPATVEEVREADCGASSGCRRHLERHSSRVAEARAALDWILQREDLDSGRTALWGNNEGAWIAAMVARDSEDVVCLILVSTRSSDLKCAAEYIARANLSLGPGPAACTAGRPSGSAMEESGIDGSLVFAEHVISDVNLGAGHHMVCTDLTGNGRLDIIGKPWSPGSKNALGGNNFILFIENLTP